MIPRQIAICLYRVAQECLDNIGSHAHATRIDMILMRRSDSLRLSVQDNGKGFDAALLNQEGRGCGILEMKERMRLINGSLVVKTRLGSGTRDVTVAPLSEREL